MQHTIHAKWPRAHLEEEEARDGRDFVLGGEVIRLVHVDREQEQRAPVLLGQALEEGQDLLAVPAPAGVEVRQHQ
jgi:hypothetical protein